MRGRASPTFSQLLTPFSPSPSYTCSLNPTRSGVIEDRDIGERERETNKLGSVEEETEETLSLTLPHSILLLSPTSSPSLSPTPNCPFHPLYPSQFLQSPSPSPQSTIPLSLTLSTSPHSPHPFPVLTNIHPLPSLSLTIFLLPLSHSPTIPPLTLLDFLSYYPCLYISS